MKKLIFAFTCLLSAIPCQAKTIYVDADASGANNGQDWDNAYIYLQDALAEATGGDEIWVAEGVYKPDQGGGQTPGDQTSTFQLINGVVIKGGYAGFGEPDPNARDIQAYETILSGDLNGDDVEVNDPCDLLTEPTRDENSYHVVLIQDDTEVMLDGFTITAGNANLEYHADCGGGMYTEDTSLTATLVNCTFISNTAKWGGGVFHVDGTTLINCTFITNAAYRGGGLCDESEGSILINCTFTSNWATMGGGTYNEDNRSKFVRCTFTGNRAGESAGAMYNYSDDGHFPTLTNCTLNGNFAPLCGGIYNTADDSICNPTLTNCILWGNSDNGGTDESAQLYFYEPDPIINYCCVQGWTGTLGGIGNIDTDPCFADPCNGGYHLKSQAGRWDPGSQSWVADDVTSPCIDAGNPGCHVGDEPEPNGNRRNMGAYGGTAEASKSPPNWRSIADLTNDWLVNSNDIKVFADYWLESGECIPSDFDRSQFVDFSDFAIFGQNWSYPSASEPGMTFHIDDCNMEEGLDLPSEEPNQPRFSVWVEGSYIHFEDQMYANCCPDELGLEKEIDGSQIILYEIGYGGLCNCMCYFPITATLGPFEDGTYTVEVYDNYGNLLGVVEVTIGQSSGPGITYQIEDCNQEASGVFSAEPPDLTRFTVTVDGLYIHFEDMMVANCCPDGLGLEMVVEDNLITIYETEYTPGGCWCICDYPITATLGPFEPGTYILEVYEDWGGFIGSTTVVIDPPE